MWWSKVPKAAEKLSIGPRFVVMIAGRSPPVPKQSIGRVRGTDPGNISNTHKKIRSCVLIKQKFRSSLVSSGQTSRMSSWILFFFLCHYHVSRSLINRMEATLNSWKQNWLCSCARPSSADIKSWYRYLWRVAVISLDLKCYHLSLHVVFTLTLPVLVSIPYALSVSEVLKCIHHLLLAMRSKSSRKCKGSPSIFLSVGWMVF